MADHAVRFYHDAFVSIDIRAHGLNHYREVYVTCESLHNLPPQEPVLKHSVHTLVFRSLKRSHDMFLANEGLPVQEDELA